MTNWRCEGMNRSWRSEGRSYSVNSLCYGCTTLAAIKIKFPNGKYEISITHGEKSHHLLRNNVGKYWIKKYNGIFTKSVTWLWFQSRSIISYYHLPTSTWHTQQISTSILYGELLCDRISYMWWWDWTTEHVCIYGPLILSLFLSLTMQPRHCEYSAV